MEKNLELSGVTTSATVARCVDRGPCLCLSGGGYRATLFHLGVLRRLNELGILAKLSAITSVSGGSILNGLLASRWATLQVGQAGQFKNFVEQVARPMREFCGKDLRTKLLFGTRLKPTNWLAVARDWFSVSANYFAEAYEPLYDMRLDELPAPGTGAPRFIFCSTNVGTGACWHFHGGPNARMGDFYTGYCEAKTTRISEAVAASSAFPPGFSALRLRRSGCGEFSRIDQWGEERVSSTKREPLQGREILLTDGGVYDNLGVEPVWRSYEVLLVSDAGRPFGSGDKMGQGIVTRLRRAADISMEQVAAVRKRWLVEQLTGGRRQGAIWTLHSRLDEFPHAEKVGYGRDACAAVQGIRTDLDAFSDPEMACLENHGYSMADAAVRSFAPGLCSQPVAPYIWPYDDWRDEQRVCNSLAQSGRRRLARDVGRYLLRFGRQ